MKCKTSRSLSYCLALIVSFLFYSGTITLAQGENHWIVCPYDGISGFEDWKKDGDRVLYPIKTTTDQSKLTVYIRAGVVEGHSETQLYVQSNFLRPSKITFEENGHSSLVPRHATKVAVGDSQVKMRDIIDNIIQKQFDTDSIEQLMLRVGQTSPLEHRYDQVTYYVDRDFFTNPVFGNIDFLGSEKIFLIDSDGVTKRLMRRIPLEGGTKYVVDWSPHLSSRAEDPSGIEALEEMDTKQFNRKTAGFLNLCPSTDATDAINDLGLDKQEIPFDITNPWKDKDHCLRALETALKANHYTSLTIVCHVPIGTDDIHCRGIKNRHEVDFSLPLADVVALCNNMNISCFYAGCNTARRGRSGTVHFISPLKAIRHIHRAMQAKTWGGYLRGLTSSNLRMLIDSATFNGIRVRTITLHRSQESMARWIIKHEQGDTGGRKSSEEEANHSGDAYTSARAWFLYKEPPPEPSEGGGGGGPIKTKTLPPYCDDNCQKREEIEIQAREERSLWLTIMLQAGGITAVTGTVLVGLGRRKIIIRCPRCSQKGRMTRWQYITKQMRCMKCKAPLDRAEVVGSARKVSTR